MRILPVPHSSVPIKVIFTSPPGEVIKKVLPNFFIGIVFVATSDVSCVNLFTDELVEKLNFSSQTPREQIKQIYSSDIHRIFIACNTHKIILRDYANNAIYSINTAYPPAPFLNYINGFYFDEKSKEVFIYGDSLFVLSPTLSDFRKISPSADIIF